MMMAVTRSRVDLPLPAVLLMLRQSPVSSSTLSTMRCSGVKRRTAGAICAAARGETRPRISSALSSAQTGDGSGAVSSGAISSGALQVWSVPGWEVGGV